MNQSKMYLEKFNRNKLEEKFKQWRNLKFFYPYRELSANPKWQALILTCMDCRITSNVFGIEDPGEAIIIRNAGALLTKDSLRSILIAIYELNVNFIAVVGHTNCGGENTKGRMEELLSKISKKTKMSRNDVLNTLGTDDASQAFLGFKDVHLKVPSTVEALQQHPLIVSVDIDVVGYIYNTQTGDIIKV
ncbi:MAG: beta-class carbonic anhydrase, partial [Candidatus Hodarchaeota archaeon]